MSEKTKLEAWAREAGRSISYVARAAIQRYIDPGADT
jgi:hypothetical protein